MGWSTELFCNIHFNRQTYNSKYEVESQLEEVNNWITTLKEKLRDLAIMTEPRKYCDEETQNPYYFVVNQFQDCITELEDSIIEKYKLELLLDNWDDCHNKEGLAINPPDGFRYDTAFLSGDFVKTIKYPDIKQYINE